MNYSVSVVIPAYNEEKNILSTVQSLVQILYISEIICVNDGSTDATLSIIKDLEKSNRNVKIITLDKNYGKAYAITEGIGIATGEIVVLLDADLKNINEGILQLLISPLLHGTHDIVVSYPGNMLDKLFKPISGQRAYFRSDLFPLLYTLKNKGYGLELYLNFTFRHKRVKSIMLPGVTHILKHEKHTWKIALKSYGGEIKELFTEVFCHGNPFSSLAYTYIFPFYLQKQTTRILFVFDSLSPIGGGSQVAALTWMKNLQKEGIVVKMLCNKNVETLIEDIASEDYIGLPYLNLNAFFPHYYPTLFLTSRIKEEIKRFAPDIIHFHEPTFFVYQVMSFAKKRNIRTVFSFQTDFTKQIVKKFPLSLLLGKKGPALTLFSLLQYDLCKKADVVLALTRYYQREISRKLSKRVFLIAPPVLDIFYINRKRAYRNPKNLLAVGRLVKGKQIDVLIEMMKYLKNSFHLTIVGSGPDKMYIRTLAKKFEIEGAITFIDWVHLPELPEVFASADLYLSASNSETFGLTYISALAAKTPCVVYDYTVSREVIPQNTAVFVNSHDPHEWAKAVRNLQENPEKYYRLCENIESSYGKIEQYKEEQSTRNLVKFYKQILKKRENSLVHSGLTGIFQQGNSYE